MINIPSVVGIYEENCQGSRPFLSIICKGSLLEEKKTEHRFFRHLILIQVEVDNGQLVEPLLWKVGDLKQIIWTPPFGILGWTIHLVEREIKKLKVWQVGHLQKL